MPTPLGVPVEMMVPALRVMAALSSEMILSRPKISMSVVLSWRSSPLTVLEILSLGGQANSSAVTMQGPMGVKPSRLLPRYHWVWRVWRFLALISLRIV